MSNEKLIDVLRIASESQDNLALKMLLLMASERILELSKTAGDNNERKN